MKIPTEGEYNLTLYVCSDGSAYIDAWSFPEESDKFLVVPVLSHGRLIDEDRLKDKWIHKDLDLFSQGWGWLHDLNQAPTIIPAKEGKP